MIPVYSYSAPPSGVALRADYYMPRIPAVPGVHATRAAVLGYVENMVYSEAGSETLPAGWVLPGDPNCWTDNCTCVRAAAAARAAAACAHPSVPRARARARARVRSQRPVRRHRPLRRAVRGGVHGGALAGAARVQPAPGGSVPLHRRLQPRRRPVQHPASQHARARRAARHVRRRRPHVPLRYDGVARAEQRRHVRPRKGRRHRLRVQSLDGAEAGRPAAGAHGVLRRRDAVAGRLLRVPGGVLPAGAGRGAGGRAGVPRGLRRGRVCGARHPRRRHEVLLALQVHRRVPHPDAAGGDPRDRRVRVSLRVHRGRGAAGDARGAGAELRECGRRLDGAAFAARHRGTAPHSSHTHTRAARSTRGSRSASTTHSTRGASRGRRVWPCA